MQEGDLGSRKQARASTLDKAMAPVLAALYSLPAYAGLGEHWLIDKADAELLARELSACLKTLPPSAYQSFAKILGAYAPWISLAVVSYNITAPRVRTTMEMRNREAISRFAGPAGPVIVRDPTPGSPVGHGGNGAEELASGKPAPDRARRFESGE